VVASTGGLCAPRELEELGNRVDAADIHDTRAELKAADLAVTAGGHGTAMEALIAGTPTLVVPRNAGQALSAKRAERLGTGIGLWPRLPRGSIAHAAKRLIRRPRYRRRAEEVAEQLTTWDGAAETAKLAAELANSPRLAGSGASSGSGGPAP
jgi:UDP:flavonoid glycosyltransferase YjiC (YdhE family)